MALYPHLSDLDLFLMVSNSRDNYAFSELYQRYWELVRKTGLRVIHNEAIIDDLVQDTFLSVFECKIVPDETFNFKSYILKIARNKAIDLIRKNKKNSKLLESLADHAGELSPAADARLINKEYEELVDKVIDEMPERMKQIFIMSRRQHLKIPEIARQLNISPETVKKQLWLAKVKLAFNLKLILAFHFIQILLQLKKM